MAEYLIATFLSSIVAWVAIFGWYRDDDQPRYKLDPDGKNFYIDDSINAIEGMGKREVSGQEWPSLMLGVESYRHRFQDELSKPAY